MKGLFLNQKKKKKKKKKKEIVDDPFFGWKGFANFDAHHSITFTESEHMKEVMRITKYEDSRCRV